MKTIMMKIILYTGLCMISSCASRKSLVGSWHNRYNAWEMGNAMLSKTGLIWHNKLVLYQDSSWQLTGTCEVLRGSKWKVQGEHLILVPDTSWGTVSPEFNKSKAELPGFILSYTIRRQNLVKRSDAFHKTTDSNGNVVIIKSKIFEKLEPYK